MKNLFALAVCFLAAACAFTSCEWDDSPEPDHPLYVTYSITAGEVEYSGTDELLIDIHKWIKANQKIYDVEVSYSTGAASEFAKTDADAIKHYEEFAPKFKAYLNEALAKLENGEYEPDNQVNATFQIYAARTQGDSGNLKYEQITLVYPPADAQ